MDDAAIQKLLSGNTTGDLTANSINQLLAWAIVPSIIFLAIFLALYIVRSVHRRNVDKAIFEIRDTLREMRALEPPTPADDETTPK